MVDLIDDEEIYELSQQGLSNKKITEYYREKGVSVSYKFIKEKVKEIYESKKLTEKENIKKISDEEIYKLIEQGLSCGEISKYFREKGISISQESIRKKSNKINEKMEKTKIKPTDEEICNLREEGLSFEKIAYRLATKGIIVTSETIRKRYKKICEEKLIQESKQEIVEFDNKQLIKGILNLVTTKKATVEQIEKIAEYYGVDLNEELNNELDER